MTTEDEAGRRRLRWASLALFVGAPVLLLILTALNLVEAADGEARAARQEALLGEIERRIAAGPGPALPADASAGYLRAGSDTLAKAELQQLLVRLAARTSSRLIEAQGEDAPGSEDTRQVQVRVTLDATHDGLFDLLHGIEMGLPLLTVVQVGLRTLPGASDGENPNPLLRVSLVVGGHWKGKAE